MNDTFKDRREKIEESLVDIVVKSWRFSRTFSRLIQKLDAGEGARYQNQYRYYCKNLEASLESAGLRIVNIEGHPYDPGMAATALNIDDFGPSDSLVVDQMLEPIIMGPDGIIKTGTVMLRRIEE